MTSRRSSTPPADLAASGLERSLQFEAKGVVHAPKAVHLVDALPMTAVGKIDKKQGRE